MYYSWAEINLNAFRHNVDTVRTLIPKGCQLLLPLKANAYGHGLEATAKAAFEFGIDWLGLATCKEALEIRSYVPNANILVLGPSEPDDVRVLSIHNITPVLVDLENARAMNESARHFGMPLQAHLKIDTGMGRIGFRYSNLDDIYAATQLSHIKITGIMTHLSMADHPDSQLTIDQQARFQEVLLYLFKRGITIPLRHMEASGAVLNIDNSGYNMVRPGILIYGGYPLSQAEKEKLHGATLEPMLSWKTRVTQIKKVPKGQSLGYNAVYTTTQETYIATIEVGYGDGYRRILSNRAEVLVKGKRYPVRGMISMDQTTVELGPDEPVVKPGDEVVLLGKQGENEITVQEMAEWMGTITYEVYTAISARVERRYMFNGNHLYNFVFSNFGLMGGSTFLN
ncbi:alanine racemase [bacterium]|nr:alanine racemase [bacterium]